MPLTPESNIVRCGAIVGSLREQIVRGELRPGDRLPTRRDIFDTCGASPLTIQKAIDQLTSDGFIITRGTQGTFVSKHPPHMCRFPLLLPHRTDGFEPVSHFYETLARVAGVLSADGQALEMPVFRGISGHADVEDYQVLLREVERRRVAGLVFAFSPHFMTDSPLVTRPDLPRVMIGGSQEQGIPLINLDGVSFFRRAIETAAERGSRRVAVLSKGMCHGGARRALADGCRRNGFTFDDDWLQYASLEFGEGPVQAVRLLMRGPARSRPNALIVDDDHLIGGAVAGLRAAGLEPGRDLELICHANFPDPIRADGPATYIGFDTRRILAACLRVIEQQRHGRSVPSITPIPAQTEPELDGFVSSDTTSPNHLMVRRKT